ncbi:endothelial cell adhesion molecule a [Chanos chanos]|uniref:Endothelial cell adhesion molecule a n=1 Tax=Chanos chanos TaxID=29144 RepID=A0A6J2WW10_CHACN|nr:endothelial cell-selective adhesion molecule-like [Chanos chanos]
MEIRTSRKLGTLLSFTFTFLTFLPGELAQLQIPHKNIDVIKGKNVVLQASYSGIIDQNTVLWNFMTNTSQIIISYTSGSISQGGPQFQGRARFYHDMPNRNLSLFINNTQVSDSGTYVCQVLVPGATSVSDQLSLNVIVPPSVPVCKLKGKPVLKGNVTLTCNSAAGKPAPLYKWKKTSPSSEVFFPPMLNETVGTLKLTNLSSGMSGKYVCTSSNVAGEQECFINLEVITSTNAGVIAGATVGAVVGFILIILFLVFLWTRRKESEEDLANEIKEDAQAPKRVSWAKSGTSSDIISKNGTLSSINTSHHPRNHMSNNYVSHSRPPPSDTASIITATGSTAGYRTRAPANSTPEHILPGYNTNPTLPRGHSGPPSTNGGSLPREDTIEPQPPRPPPLPTGVTAANISRMGGVPIMVPAQNQAGSLV